MSPPREQESGVVECHEILRAMRHGAMQPLLCRADDNAHYVVKPFSSGGDWPQVLEWVCARLGRAFGLPIPNYRQISIHDSIAQEWNAVHPRQVEPGLGFGSQLIESAMECDAGLVAQVDPALQRRLLAFDWWVRNRDRVAKNPNLLWSTATRLFHVIDHEQAGQTDGGDGFWSLHLFAAHGAGGPEWPPPDLREELRRVLTHREAITSELPSTWTSQSNHLSWFFTQLTRSLDDTPHKDWRNYD